MEKYTERMDNVMWCVCVCVCYFFIRTEFLYANAMQPHWENSITNRIMQWVFLASESLSARALILPHKTNVAAPFPLATYFSRLLLYLI